MLWTKIWHLGTDLCRSTRRVLKATQDGAQFLIQPEKCLDKTARLAFGFQTAVRLDVILVMEALEDRSQTAEIRFGSGNSTYATLRSKPPFAIPNTER